MSHGGRWLGRATRYRPIEGRRPPGLHGAAPPRQFKGHVGRCLATAWARDARRLFDRNIGWLDAALAVGDLAQDWSDPTAQFSDHALGRGAPRTRVSSEAVCRAGLCSFLRDPVSDCSALCSEQCAGCAAPKHIEMATSIAVPRLRIHQFQRTT